MVVKGRVGKVKNFGFSAAMILGLAGATYATNALADEPMMTKAPPMAAAPAAPAACDSLPAFFLSSCQLAWYGVRFYGTVDIGGGYQTHGSPFDPNFTTGASYFINKPSRQAEWIQSPNGMSQSVVGVEIKEPMAPGWAFVGRAELAFDPYSGLLANAPQALQDAIHVPLNQQEIPVDSSRWGWLAGQIYSGVSSPIYGTLTFGRQNALLTDGVNAYDPMGGAYAFSPIGFSGLTCGAGDTEECRWTTAIKYRVNIGDARLAVMGQPITGTSAYNAYNPNNGAVEGDIGGDVRVGPGLLSLDGLGSYIVNAVNIGPSGGATNAAGVPVAPFPANTYLSATLSNQTSFMALAKYAFGSWSSPPPIVGKGPVPPPAPVGIPLTLYAGYEWIQFANPTNPVTTSFPDDGFTFNYVSVAGGAPPAIGNGTTIANNAYNASCGTGTGCSDKIFQVMWVGAKYGITRDLDVIGAYYHYIQSQYVSGVGICANPTAHGQCAGTEDMWSAVLDWRFLPKWDAYIGTFFSQVNAGLSNGYLARNNLASTAGVRFRF
jgi:predicted porin